MNKRVTVLYFMILSAAHAFSAMVSLPTPQILPKRIYGLEGHPCEIRWSTLVYSPERSAVLYDLQTGPGKQYSDRLIWNPTEAETGKSFGVTVYAGLDFQKLGEAEGEFIFCNPKDAKTSGPIRWLPIGDSLTVPGYYIAQTVEKLRSLIPEIMIETIGTQQTKEGSFHHEGRGGWSWARYLEAFPPKSQFQSPFVFGAKGADDFDFSRYLREQAGGKVPQIITIFLGANDVYGISNDFSPTEVDEIVERARTMVDKIRAAAPESVIGIIPPPPCSDQDAFGLNYGNGVTEWQYRRAMQYYVAGLLRAFDGRWDENIYIIPGYLGFDPTAAYPVTAGRSQNALHPEAQGFAPISLSISAWLVHVLGTRTFSEEY